VANTWEQAVEWLRQQPDQQTLVRDCYFDDPLIEACERFVNSEEWQATLRYLPRVTGKVLDLGAGRGISSYGLAKAGWQVTALEPDPSNLVGAGAIRGASLTLKLELGPWESTLNSFPIVGEALHNKLTAPLKRRFGTSITTLLTHERTPWSAWVLHQLGRQVSQRDHSPGRLYSFVAVKP
jgi:SAM-dependent methyltransferase